MTTVRLKPAQASTLADRIDGGGATTLVLGPGEYVVDPLYVGRSIALVGEAGPEQTVLRARSDSGLLNVYGPMSTVTVRGLTLRGGRADAGGAILASNDVRLSVEHCRFIDNEALQLRGGGIDAGDDVALTVSRCLFVHNRCERGAAVALGVAARAVIDRSVFVDNAATLGGAIWVSESVQLRIMSSTFLGNRASHSTGGGTLFVTGTATFGPTVELINCLVSGERPFVNNPDRPGELSFAHCIVPPGALAQAPHRNEGHNLDIQPDLVELGEHLWALRAGSTGSGTADLNHIDASSLDLRGIRLVQDGAADPGALASPPAVRQAGQYDSIEG